MGMASTMGWLNWNGDDDDDDDWMELN